MKSINALFKELTEKIEELSLTCETNMIDDSDFVNKRNAEIQRFANERIKEKMTVKKSLENIQSEIDKLNEVSRRFSSILENQLDKLKKIRNYYYYQDIKSKWEIDIYSMLIIGKYLKSNNDYINVMKVCKKFNQLTQMYHYNLIDECELFINMQSQYFYSGGNRRPTRKGMKHYVYWYTVEYPTFCRRKTNEVFKRVILNNKKCEKREYPLQILRGKCIVPEGVTSIGDSCFYGCKS